MDGLEAKDGWMDEWKQIEGNRLVRKEGRKGINHTNKIFMQTLLTFAKLVNPIR